MLNGRTSSGWKLVTFWGEREREREREEREDMRMGGERGYRRWGRETEEERKKVADHWQLSGILDEIIFVLFKISPHSIFDRLPMWKQQHWDSSPSYTKLRTRIQERSQIRLTNLHGSQFSNASPLSSAPTNAPSYLHLQENFEMENFRVLKYYC